MQLVKNYLTQNPCYQYNISRADSRYITFQSRGPIGLMLHSVGCAQPSAEVFFSRWNKSSYTNACVHAFIDANSGTVYQTLPWNYRGWHGGGSSNNTHVGVEMCESGAIRYTSGTRFVVTDSARAKADCARAYQAAVELFAMLCEQYKLDPLTKIVSHKEGYSQGIATNHGDPEHYWKGCGMNYTMDGFRADVKAKMLKNSQPQPKKETEPEMTKEEIQNYFAEELQKVKDEMKAEAKEEMKKELVAELGKYINEAKDIPHDSVRDQMRELLDHEIINGGTNYETNPDDIGLPYNIVRALVVAKRYTDAKFENAKISSNL